MTHIISLSLKYFPYLFNSPLSHIIDSLFAWFSLIQNSARICSIFVYGNRKSSSFEQYGLIREFSYSIMSDKSFSA